VSERIQVEQRDNLNKTAITLDHELRRLVQHDLEQVLQWSRSPTVSEPILELVKLANDLSESSESELSKALRAASQEKQIDRALKELSRNESLEFIVWHHSGATLATWLFDPDDLGTPISLINVESFQRVLRGTAMVSPPRLDNAHERQPSTVKMAILVPIQGTRGRFDAVMLIRGTGLYERVCHLLHDIPSATGISSDGYLVSKEGMMLSDSLHMRSLIQQGLIADAPDQVVTQMRVSDPTSHRTGTTVQRASQPLTIAAAGILMHSSSAAPQPYRNYAGELVSGAWRWLDDLDFGLVVERNAQEMARPANVILLGFGFLGLLLAGSGWLFDRWWSTRTPLGISSDPLAQYEIGEPLGSGGMGVVFRAKHKHLGRPTALKVLRQDRQEVDDLLRFDREARVAASLISPHIVTIYDYGRTADGEFYMAMQLLRGLTLSEVVARSGPLPFGRSLYIMRQICDALVDAHDSGLVHRDIKPQNVMLSLDAVMGDWAAVFDFGLAKPLTPANDMYQTHEAIWAGTPMYMAPERFRDPTSMDFRSDLYSLGCLAYFLISGHPPFAECDPESLFALIISQEPIRLETHLGKPVPNAIEQLIKHCMAKSASDRFDNAQQLADAIDELRKEFPWSLDEARKWWKTHGEEFLSSNAPAGKS
jgi:hypothetical protein